MQLGRKISAIPDLNCLVFTCSQDQIVLNGVDTDWIYLSILRTRTVSFVDYAICSHIPKRHVPSVSNYNCDVLLDYFYIFNGFRYIDFTLSFLIIPKECFSFEISRKNTEVRPFQCESLREIAIHKVRWIFIALFKNADWTFVSPSCDETGIGRVVPRLIYF